MVDILYLSAAVVTVCTAFGQAIRISYKRGYDLGTKDARRDAADARRDADNNEIKQLLAKLVRRANSGDPIWPSDDRVLPPSERDVS
jgi:hypothetical protein